MKKFIFLPLLLMLLVSTGHTAQVNKVAAVVNGQVITMYDLQKESIPELIKARISPNDQSRTKEINAIFKKVLDAMILDILVKQEAKRLKATVSNSEIEAEISRIMKARKVNRKQMEEQLKQQGSSVAKLRADIENNILRQKVMAMEVGRRVVVTPQEISDYYEQHKDELIDRAGLHMGLIVYNPKVNPASISSQIKSGKMTFAEACAKYSIGPNKDKGGDQGPVEWDRLNAEWEARLNKMKPGDITEPFTTQGFKAQIYLFRPGGGEEKQLTLQEATPIIDSILRQPKAKGRFEDYSKQLRDKAVIDIKL